VKFLLVSPFTSISGSAVRFWNIAQSLQRAGHDVVYVERRPKNAPPAQLEGVQYLSTPTFMNLVFDIIVSLIFNICVLIRHHDCDVFYALKPAPNNCIPAMLARLFGATIILDIDDLDFGYLDEGIMRNISSFFYHQFPRRFALVTCHTEKLRLYIIQRIGIPEYRTYFLTQCVSDIFLARSPSQRPATIGKSIVYLATLGITSDFDDILPMFVHLCKKHKDLSIKILGDGVRRPYFEKLVESLEIGFNVHFLGRIDHKLIPVVIAHNWIGLNYMRPTITNNCRAILKLREYLAAGLQVVCNDAGDAYIFKNHVYVEPTIEAMETRTMELLDKGMSVNYEGRRFIEDYFRWDKSITALLERIRGVVPANQRNR
jgi:glycosyltransferase involved in cell wall biosynthesis